MDMTLPQPHNNLVAGLSDPTEASSALRGERGDTFTVARGLTQPACIARWYLTAFFLFNFFFLFTF